jgi:hypothetical protein
MDIFISKNVFSVLRNKIFTRFILGAAAVFFLAASLPAQSITSLDSTLKKIELLYNTGQYVSAELEARRFSEETLLSDSIKVQIEQWIGFSLIAQGKNVLARDRFILLLSINPDYEPDPVLTSPKILAVFNDAKVKFVSHRKNKPDTTGSVPALTAPELITYRTIAFPGWEQIYQGRTTSGYVFLGTGAASLASGIIFEVLRSNSRNRYLGAKTVADINSAYNDYNRYKKAEIYSFLAFAAVYLLSEVDVFTEFTDFEITPNHGMNDKNGHSLRFSFHF